MIGSGSSSLNDHKKSGEEGRSKYSPFMMAFLPTLHNNEFVQTVQTKIFEILKTDIWPLRNALKSAIFSLI